MTAENLGLIWPPERVAEIMVQTEKLQEIVSTGKPKDAALARLQLKGGIGVIARISGATGEEVKEAMEKGKKIREERRELDIVYDKLPWD
jgi:hypothetical protein